MFSQHSYPSKNMDMSLLRKKKKKKDLQVGAAPEVGGPDAGAAAVAAAGGGVGARAGATGADEDDAAEAAAGAPPLVEDVASLPLAAPPIDANSSGVNSGLSLALFGNSCSERKRISVPLMIRASFFKSMQA